jgi:hypothetical protein
MAKEQLMTLTPAYGRDYKSAKALLEDFHNEKDFILNTPRGTTYINKPQIESGTIIQFRYSNLRKLTVYTQE